MRSPFKLAIFFSNRRISEALAGWAAEESLDEEKNATETIHYCATLLWGN